jgi:hypothetical protein
VRASVESSSSASRQGEKDSIGRGDLEEGRKRGRGYRSVNNLGTLQHATGSSSSTSGQGLRREERWHGTAGRYEIDESIHGGRIVFGKLEMWPNVRITASKGLERN